MFVCEQGSLHLIRNDYTTCKMLACEREGLGRRLHKCASNLIWIFVKDMYIYMYYVRIVICSTRVDSICRWSWLSNCLNTV